MAEPGSFHARLPQADARQVRARNRALQVLAAVRLAGPDGPLSTKVALADGEVDGPALLFTAPPGWLALSATQAGGLPAEPLDEAGDLASSLADLGEAEPVLLAIERLTGIALDPVGVERPAPAGALRFRLTVGDDARVVHDVTLSVSVALAETWPAPALNGRALGPAARAPAPCRLLVDGPALPRDGAAALRVGDVVLLPRAEGAAGWPAALRPHGARSGAHGAIDWARRSFSTISLEDGPMLETDTPTAAVDPGQGAGDAQGLAVADLPVRVRVAIDGVTTPVVELARLQVGSTLLLEGLGESPAVTVLAEDKPVASGRLVAVGEAYGVIIEQLAG